MPKHRRHHPGHLDLFRRLNAQEHVWHLRDEHGEQTEGMTREEMVARHEHLHLTGEEAHGPS